MNKNRSAATGESRVLIPLLERVGRGPVLLLAVAAYWLVCFAPYNWTPPASYTLNDARVVAVAGGPSRPDPAGLVFDGAGLAEIPISLATSWQHSPQRVQLELDLMCSKTQQFGPARIFSLSSDALRRNLTLGQDGSALILRLLRPGSNSNGIPEFRLAEFFYPCERKALSLDLLAGAMQLRVNGELVLQEAAPQASLKRWAASYPVVLGNEASWDRGWAGTLFDLQLTVDGAQLVDGLSTAVLPQGAWLLSRRALGTHRFNLVPFRDDHPLAWLDNLLNVVGFIPFGILLALVWGTRLNWLFAGILAALLSASIELGQVGFEGRFPSITDVVTNTFGGTLGFLFGIARLRKKGGGCEP